MKSTNPKLLAILLLLTASSCEEEITTPTTVKLNVTDTKGSPIKDVVIYFSGYKRKGLLNFLETFSVNSKTDTNGNCAMAAIIPKETIEVNIAFQGDSLPISKENIFLSLDSLNFVPSIQNLSFVNDNYKKGQTTKFYYRVQR